MDPHEAVDHVSPNGSTMLINRGWHNCFSQEDRNNQSGMPPQHIMQDHSPFPFPRNSRLRYLNISFCDRQVASMILDNKTLDFYKYDGDHKPILENVRDRLNKVADNWTREQKDKCLEETEMSFKVHLFFLPSFLPFD